MNKSDSHKYSAQDIEQISDFTCHKISPNIDKPNSESFHDECLQIKNKIALLVITSIVVAGVFTLTIGIGVNNTVFAKNYKPQTEQQVNNCGNNASPANITCSNLSPNAEVQKNIDNTTIVHYLFLPFP